MKKVIGVGAKFISARSPDHNNTMVIPQLWQDYMGRGEEITNRLSWTDMGIVMSIRESKNHPDEMYYMAGTEVSAVEQIPDGMSAQIIPQGNYAIFTHKGKLDKLSHTMNYIYGSWLAKSEHTLREAPELEIYGPRFKPNADDSELEVYIPII